jgi:hypothetical protein
LDNGTVGFIYIITPFNTNQSKELSDDSDAILTAQGIGFLLRKAMRMCSITLNLVHHSTASPPTLTATAVSSGGLLKGTTEIKTLDDKPREQKDFALGTVLVKLKTLTSVEEAEDTYLKDGWVGQGGLSEVIVNEKAGWTNSGVRIASNFLKISILSANLSLLS